MSIDLEPSPLSLDLHAFATFPCYVETLYELARLAIMEGWRFRGQEAPMVGYANLEILARYLEGVYRRHAAGCNATEDVREQDGYLYLRSGYAGFHTGLFSRKENRAIYALFLNDPFADKPPWWRFSKFIVDDGDWPEWAEMPPLYLTLRYQPHEELYHPEWRVAVRLNTLRENDDLMDQIPVKLHGPKAFHQYIQRLIASSKTMARQNLSHIAPVLFDDSLQYAMPLFLSDGNTEFALILKPDPMRIYIGHEIVPVREAYHMARQLGPVRAYWLAKLAGGVSGEWAPYRRLVSKAPR